MNATTDPIDDVLHRLAARTETDLEFLRTLTPVGVEALRARRDVVREEYSLTTSGRPRFEIRHELIALNDKIEVAERWLARRTWLDEMRARRESCGTAAEAYLRTLATYGAVERRLTRTDAGPATEDERGVAGKAVQAAHAALDRAIGAALPSPTTIATERSTTP